MHPLIDPLAAVADSGTVLYHYWRSSSSWRVRWALIEKGIPFRAAAVDLLKGEQRSLAHRARSPLAMVPVLHIDGIDLAESVAILEYLEETHPSLALAPATPLLRARMRQLVQIIAADTQPLQNSLLVVSCQRILGRLVVRVLLQVCKVLLDYPPELAVLALLARWLLVLGLLVEFPDARSCRCRWILRPGCCRLRLLACCWLGVVVVALQHLRKILPCHYPVV